MELKKTYGYDLAQSIKEQPELAKEPEMEILKFLAYYDLNAKVGDIINEFYDSNDFFFEEEIVSLCVSSLAHYIGYAIEPQDPLFRKYLRQHAMKIYKIGGADGRQQDGSIDE